MQNCKDRIWKCLEYICSLLLFTVIVTILSIQVAAHTVLDHWNTTIANFPSGRCCIYAFSCVRGKLPKSYRFLNRATTDFSRLTVHWRYVLIAA
jgi:hypothetical protein